MSSPRTVARAYSTARRVYEGKLKRAAGSRRLHDKDGVNINSANDLIDGYRHLRRGESFQRTLSGPYIRYYLSHILRDSGQAALQTALHSLWLHIGYFERQQPSKMRTMRKLAAQFALAAGGFSLADQVETEFEKDVKRSMADSAARRKKRLRGARTKPDRVPIVILGFVRNADVVAEVKVRARGICEGCNKPAPFLRRNDGKPYLEVHHKKRLADGGEDTVENAEALCPNCHRKKHFGQ